MNKFIVVLVALLVLVGAFLILNNYADQEKQTDTKNIEVTEKTETGERDTHLGQFEDRSIEVAFDYPEGTDGYVVDDLSQFIGEESQDIEVVKVYRLMNEKEKFELENSEGGREGPPVIQLMVFKNDQNQSAGNWIDSFPAFSNINLLLGEVDSDVVVGGANAVSYTTDGLYMADNVVVASGDFIYHFIGSYHERDSLIHQDFRAIIDSVRFIPGEGVGGEVGGKIDVKVACESALAYMLFQTGEQADKFVEECVAGKHPEVIERYINDTGLDGASI